jgi:MOSC domain-containing protein YiiM
MEDLSAQPCAGAYAQVIHPGRIQLGDPIEFA